MRYIDEFRTSAIIRPLADAIRTGSKRPLSIMEICGGHTNTIIRYALADILPPTITLVSGPGCPVCVTPIRYIDSAVEYAQRPGVITVTFGDLIRLQGSVSTLMRERELGADVRVSYSPAEALVIAKENPERTVLFLAIGFETTTPLTAALIDEAAEKKVDNLVVLPSHRVMPPAMAALVADGDIPIDAFICPGHVSVITGAQIYEPVAREHKKICVVSGFEPADMLRSILMIVRQAQRGEAAVEIEYTRAVTREGNRTAQAMIQKIFAPIDGEWRGLGTLPESALGIRQEYERFDAEKRFGPVSTASRENPACVCADVLRAKKVPSDCPLYAKACTPEHPEGACMVSPEGSCNIFFRYGKR